jgi:BolA protein
MRQRLAALAPIELEIIDESHLHAGHAGARSGRGHYVLRIRAAAFSGKTPLQRHRLVYEALGDMLQTDIHALSIKALAPGE